MTLVSDASAPYARATCSRVDHHRIAHHRIDHDPIDHHRWILAAVLLIACILPVRASAQSHTALDFDGVDDYVEMGDPLDMNGPFTVEAWIYARSGEGGGRFLSTRSGSTGYEMDVNDNNGNLQLRFTFHGSAEVQTSFTAHMNTWTHVAGTWTGPAGSGTIRLYIDGQQVNTGTRLDPIDPSMTNFLLGRNDFGYGHYDGRIDEVRVWNAELTEATIAEWMNRHVTPDHPDYAALEASWRLDEGMGQTAACDVSSPTNDGRLGDTAGEDDMDPAWVASDVVPERESSVGGVKARYRSTR